jgi:hypothetical protein
MSLPILPRHAAPRDGNGSSCPNRTLTPRTGHASSCPISAIDRCGGKRPGDDTPSAAAVNPPASHCFPATWAGCIISMAVNLSHDKFDYYAFESRSQRGHKISPRTRPHTFGGLHTRAAASARRSVLGLGADRAGPASGLRRSQYSLYRRLRAFTRSVASVALIGRRTTAVVPLFQPGGSITVAGVSAYAAVQPMAAEDSARPNPTWPREPLSPGSHNHRCGREGRR